jgi:hypothetical protein
MARIDYKKSAELFPSRSRKANRPMGYRRFDTAAEAVRFAIEELPREFLLGAYMEVDEKRFNHTEIRGLYESPDYPLTRPADKAAKKTEAPRAKAPVPA